MVAPNVATRIVIPSGHESELHFPAGNAYACVQWNLAKRTETTEVPDGSLVAVFRYWRNGQPFINFADVREERTKPGSFYVDEDSPVQGGMDAAFARQIAAELTAAVDYLEAIRRGEIQV